MSTAKITLELNPKSSDAELRTPSPQRRLAVLTGATLSVSELVYGVARGVPHTDSLSPAGSSIATSISDPEVVVDFACASLSRLATAGPSA